MYMYIYTWIYIHIYIYIIYIYILYACVCMCVCMVYVCVHGVCRFAVNQLARVYASMCEQTPVYIYEHMRV